MSEQPAKPLGCCDNWSVPHADTICCVNWRPLAKTGADSPSGRELPPEIETDTAEIAAKIKPTQQQQGLMAELPPEQGLTAEQFWQENRGKYPSLPNLKFAEAFAARKLAEHKCDLPSAEWSRHHLAHIQRFLIDMYQTMVDPVEEYKGDIRQLCDLLLMRAREDRETANKVVEQAAEIERLKHERVIETTIIDPWQERVEQAERERDELVNAIEQLIEWERDYRTINNLGKNRPHPFQQAEALLARLKGKA